MAKRNPMRKEWQNAKRIVIKIGSSLLVDEASGKLAENWLATLASDIADLQREGREIILVA